MFIITGILSVALFIGGGIVTPFDTNAAIGLYASSTVPIILYKVFRSRREPEPRPAEETPHEEAPGDPVPPV